MPSVGWTVYLSGALAVLALCVAMWVLDPPPRGVRLGCAGAVVAISAASWVIFFPAMSAFLELRAERRDGKGGATGGGSG